jgi:hypothetical protein
LGRQKFAKTPLAGARMIRPFINKQAGINKKGGMFVEI